MAKRDKNLSQAEIDALAAQAEDANLPTETAEPGIADAEDMPSPPARGARTLSQEEIDAILFTDSDKEPTSVEDTTVVEEITPTDEPPPLRKTPATRKTKPSRKIRPPEEVTVIEELPPAEEVFAADELDEEEVPLEGSLVELAQRMDRVEASCERLDHATSWIESISAVTERLQTIEATLATLVQMERNEEDIDDILDRLRKIEETTDIDAVLERLRDIQATASKTSLVKENFNVVESEIAKLSGRIEAITATLKDSIGYGIHRDFSCRSCGSKGHVAITIRCTHCGKEGWMGWWPEK